MENRQLTVLYGSQTGSAQDLAEQIWRESKRYHFKGTVTSMDNYDIRSLIHEKHVIFVCSTTGQGEEPDNMKAAWKFLLRKSLPTNSLNGVSFAVLGLGDSSYAKFNFVAKRLNKRLQQLGGQTILPIGLGDDQHDLGSSAVSLPWISDLWNKLLAVCPIPDGLSILTDAPRQLRWSVEVIGGGNEGDSIQPFDGNIYQNCTDAVFDKPFDAEVLKNTRTTSENHFQDVRLISFSCNDITWTPGDVLVLRPQNSPEQVNELFMLLAEHGFDFNADTIVTIKEFDSGI